MKSANPALKDNTFTRYVDLTDEDRMTVMGTVQKASVLMLILLVTASITWSMVFNVVDGRLAVNSNFMVFTFGGLIGGLIFCLITCFKHEWAPVTAPIYAAFEGLFIGGISAVFERMYPGIVPQAAGLTFGIMFALLAAYQCGLIKATPKLRRGLMICLIGILLVYLVNLVMHLFGTKVPYLHEASPIGIGISLVICIVASLFLVLDFDFIEKGAEMGAPKHMEWVGAFGLMVTLVWLYIEILRLLMILRGMGDD